MSKTITIEKLLSALPRTQSYVLKGEHALKGETIVVRALSAEGYTTWLATQDPADSRTILLSYGIAEPVIGPAEAERLASLDAALVVELSNAVLAFNGFGAALSEPAAEAAEGDDSFRDGATA